MPVINRSNSSDGGSGFDSIRFLSDGVGIVAQPATVRRGARGARFLEVSPRWQRQGNPQPASLLAPGGHHGRKEWYSRPSVGVTLLGEQASPVEPLNQRAKCSGSRR